MPCNDCSRTEKCPPCPHEEQEKAESLHKWKCCDQCRHPEHSSKCSVCFCLAVTSEEDLAATCRGAGGCPMHPVLPPERPLFAPGAEAYYREVLKLDEPVKSKTAVSCAVLHVDADGNAVPCPDETFHERLMGSEPSTECEGGCRIYTAPPCRDPAKCSCGGEWWKHGCKHSLPPEPRCEGCGHTDDEGCGCPPRCTCGCPKGAHMGKPRGCIPHGFHEYEAPEEHEKTAMCGYCDAGLPMACTCGPDEACGDPCDLGEAPETPDVVHKHVYAYQTGGVFKCSCGAVRLLTDPGEEPPLTPEEHNLGPEGVDCVFDACPRDPDDCENGCRAAADELSREANEMACQDCLAGAHGPNAHREAPPQPDRRPPYLLAYSVQGHLYEVAVPGDATVAALDGRLVITHQLGPVAGICQIAPIISEEN